jgi:serine protease AprX
MLAAAAQAAKPPVKPAPPAPHKTDADRDKLFDDLEARAAGLADPDDLGVIVVLREPAQPDKVRGLERRAGLAVVKRFTLIEAVSGKVPKGRLEALAADSLVDHVELNSRVRAWNDTAQESFGVTAARINAPSLDGNADSDPASYTRDDLVAAVIDTGIDAGHRDLDGGKVIAFKDFVNGAIAPYDDEGHGTHVAATIAGDGEARGDRLHRGVAPGAALVGIKVLDGAGNGTMDTVLSGIEWAVQNRATYGIEAINLSLGAAGCSDGADADSLAVDRATDAGLVVSVAAGNEGAAPCTIGSPGAAAKAVTVGAMADMGVGGFFQARFSSRGKTLDGRVKPDVSAPGVEITSAAANTADGYAVHSGTSMATPFVAGVALLMLDASPALAPQAVKDKLMQTAIDWGRGPTGAAGGTGADPEYGAGRLDAYAALRSAGAALGGGPSGPTHEHRDGTLSGTGTSADYELEVRDTAFPIAATLVLTQLTRGSAASPDFDLYLFDPSGKIVASAETTSRQESLSFRPPALGTYTLRVRSYRGNGEYSLDWSAGLRDPGYVRPKGASPLRVALVPAFKQCTTDRANTQHGAPLAFGACSPPVQASDHLTVGSPEANGAGASSVGFVLIRVIGGNSTTVQDEADVAVHVKITDVRRKADLTDYTGGLLAKVGIRGTDKLNGTSGTDSGTSQDFTLDFAVPCVATASTGPGSDCTVGTSVDAVAPGAVVEGARSVWQLDQIQVYDGGADGLPGTGDNTPFAVQGVFVP